MSRGSHRFKLSKLAPVGIRRRGAAVKVCGNFLYRSVSTLIVGIALTLSLVAIPQGYAQTRTIYLIAGPGVTLSAKDVKDVYLGKKAFSGSTQLVPVGNAVGFVEFIENVLGVTPAQFEAIWSKRSFRDALNPPKLLMSDTAVINFVKTTPGAIGYVSKAPVGVTLIETY